MVKHPRSRSRSRSRRATMVPVISEEGKALFPTKERRARRLMERNEALPHFHKGIFCIRLIRKESEQRETYPQIALGIDPGSKREGYTVATSSGVILNITTNTPYWVKDHVETRRNLRRTRRQRKTPYRKCRSNRASLNRKGRVPPSTKARWDAKLRIIKVLVSILPITCINIEDINAITKEGKRKWNAIFSPLQVGKKYFEDQILTLYSHIRFMKTEGFATKNHRTQRGFAKGKAKLDYTWEAHNSDSHSLAEIALGVHVEPYLGLYKLEFLEFHRRQLHVQIPIIGNTRKPYGSTVSLGMSRGSVLRYKNKLCYLGGSSKGKIAIHSIITGKRIKQFIKKEEVKVLYNSKWRTQLLPRFTPWGSLRGFL